MTSGIINRGFILRLFAVFFSLAIVIPFVHADVDTKATPKLFEDAAVAREEAAGIWEGLGDRIKSAAAWAEAAASWEKAATGYARLGDSEAEKRSWKRFRAALAKRDESEVRIEIVSGNNQKARITQPVEPFVVRLKTQDGKPVEGVEVAFDITVRPPQDETARMIQTMVVTDAGGVAAARLQLGQAIGRYLVTVSVPKLSDEPIVFELVALSGSPVKLEIVGGNNQVLRVNQVALSPLMVKVTDVHGNPVSGVGVDYRIVSEPRESVGQSLSQSEALTDDAGMTGVRFRAGHLGGSYLILVESGELEGSPSKFEMLVRQTIPTMTIRGQRIEGTTDTTFLLANSEIKVDETYLLPELGRTLRSELKRVFATGRYQDVSVWIETEGEEGDQDAVAIIRVEERPRIGTITVSGLKRVKKDDVIAVLGITEGAPFALAGVERARYAMLDFLEGEGYLNAEIGIETSVVESAEKGQPPRIDVVFQVSESKQVKIHRMNLVGNEYFSDWSLNWHMKTGAGKIYKEAEYEADRQKIMGRYFEVGFLSATMSDPVIRFDKNKNMIVDVVIEEGPQYKIGDVSFVGNTAVSSEELMAHVQPGRGEIFRAKKFFGSVEKLRLMIAKRGYAEARVVPQEKLNLQEGIVDFVVRVVQGEVLYLEKIIVEGNFKTKEKIITREIQIAPGDVIDGEAIDAAKKRLEKLGFFDPGSVMVTLGEGSDSHYRTLVVKVTEGKTGQLQFGGGYSSADGLVGFLSLSKKNFDPTDFFTFTGAGQSISISAEIGGQKNSASLSWSEPYFRDKPISLGLDLHNVFQEREGFDWRRRGGGLSLGHNYGRSGRLNYKYDAEQIQILNVTNVAPSDVQVEANFPIRNFFTRTTTSVTTSYTHDTRNDYIFPTSGHLFEISNQLAGEFFGGNVSFSRPALTLIKFKPVFTKHVIAWRGQYSTITNFFDPSNEIPSVQKFNLGGASSIRGYAERSVQIYSPNQVLIGPGKSFALSNLEYRIPLADDKSVSIVGFADVGGVFIDSFTFDLPNLVSGIGAGVRFVTPLGPIRLDYGYGLNFPSKNRSIVHFSVGQMF